ncbi:MAG: M1 family peptidase [Chitinophagaceae bacterium]|nr:MAG: M1 family peptidase [Chitinophagaceae bacterium]
MKKLLLAVTVSLLCLTLGAQSKFNPKELFNPQFYPYPGNAQRSAGGEPGAAYWQNRADYSIDCTLDTIAHKVTGEVTITYTNNSPDQLPFLWLQLDQNIYKKESRGSSTTTQAGGRWANGEFTQGDVISAMTIGSAGNSYTPKYMINDTRMQVWLKEPLNAAGEKLELKISFSFDIPEYGTDRMGRLQTRNGWIYQVAQWFPRLCVYDDLQGWNLLPYLGAGEFYLEYGDIRFDVTAPAGLLLVGSGELLNPEECFTPEQLRRYNTAAGSDKTVMIRTEKELKDPSVTGKKPSITWKYRISNARDAAWSASRAFIMDAAKINLSDGKKSLAISVYPSESAIGKKGNDWRRSTEMTKASIEHYSAKWFSYPYPAAINVAGIVGGMEYPGIVFCSYQSVGADLWSVTDHELGHTWFPMIVGSNERKYAWMDEGFNTFINDLSTEEFNRGEFKDAGFFGDANSDMMVKYTFNDEMDGLFTTPDVIQQDNLGIAAYMKPAQMLHALRDVVLGKDRFDAAFREYIRRWAFKHPTPWDFFHTIENVAGEDLSWFWRSWVFNNWKLDLSVKEVKYIKDTPANGSDITIENLEKMAMPAVVLVKESNGKDHRIELPVEVWQRGPVWTFSVLTTSEIREVVVDPDRQLPDWNRNNNRWKK